MPKMRAAQVPHPKGAFEIVEREVPEPGPGAVRIKVQACGICHSDSLTKEGTYQGIQYPRVRSMNELFPLERAAEAYDRMMSGKARFRVVLDIGH